MAVLTFQTVVVLGGSVAGWGGGRGGQSDIPSLPAGQMRREISRANGKSLKPHQLIVGQDSGESIICAQNGPIRAAQRQKRPSPKVAAVALTGLLTQPPHSFLLPGKKGSGCQVVFCLALL